METDNNAGKEEENTTPPSDELNNNNNTVSDVDKNKEETQRFNLLPEVEENYSKKEYWDYHYKFNKQEQYDWLQTYLQLKPFITNYLKKEYAYLVIGCGNALYSGEMYDDGYKNIINIDYSKEVIEVMSQRNATRPDMKWIYADATDMSIFKNEEFDVIIDKSVLDSIMCSEEAERLCDKMSTEVRRVTKTGGHWLVVSYSDDRYEFLCTHAANTEKKWKNTTIKLQNPYWAQGLHYLYILEKLPDT